MQTQPAALGPMAAVRADGFEVRKGASTLRHWGFGSARICHALQGGLSLLDYWIMGLIVDRHKQNKAIENMPPMWKVKRELGRIFRKMFPPMWKVKRELVRIGRQLKWGSFDAATFWYRKLPFSIVKSYFWRQTVGALPLTDRVAIFVLFQPKGIAASTFFTLKHLAQQNWSVLIVSNAALSAADRAKLASYSARVVERPNIGYDFGAYREGWNWLHHERHGLTRLIMMNDSTWFPLRADDTSLARMEAHGSDLTGHIYKCETVQRQGQDHVEAHLLIFSRKLIDSTRMKDFWKTYKMSSSRVNTIIFGEKGITKVALKSGFKADGLLNRELMTEILSEKTPDQLKHVVNNFVFYESNGEKHKSMFLKNFDQSLSWKTTVINWVNEQLTTSIHNFTSVAFFYPAIADGKMGFMKKSNEVRFHLARVAALKCIADGQLPAFAPEVMAEMQAMVDKYDQSPDWRA